MNNLAAFAVVLALPFANGHTTWVTQATSTTTTSGHHKHKSTTTTETAETSIATAGWGTTGAETWYETFVSEVEPTRVTVVSGGEDEIFYRTSFSTGAIAVTVPVETVVSYLNGSAAAADDIETTIVGTETVRTLPSGVGLMTASTDSEAQFFIPTNVKLATDAQTIDSADGPTITVHETISVPSDGVVSVTKYIQAVKVFVADPITTSTVMTVVQSVNDSTSLTTITRNASSFVTVEAVSVNSTSTAFPNITLPGTTVVSPTTVNRTYTLNRTYTSNHTFTRNVTIPGSVTIVPTTIRETAVSTLNRTMLSIMWANKTATVTEPSDPTIVLPPTTVHETETVVSYITNTATITEPCDHCHGGMSVYTTHQVSSVPCSTSVPSTSTITWTVVTSTPVTHPCTHSKSRAPGACAHPTVSDSTFTTTEVHTTECSSSEQAIFRRAATPPVWSMTSHMTSTSCSTYGCTESAATGCAHPTVTTLTTLYPVVQTVTPTVVTLPAITIVQTVGADSMNSSVSTHKTFTVPATMSWVLPSLTSTSTGNSTVFATSTSVVSMCTSRQSSSCAGYTSSTETHMIPYTPGAPMMWSNSTSFAMPTSVWPAQTGSAEVSAPSATMASTGETNSTASATPTVPFTGEATQNGAVAALVLLVVAGGFALL